jgi:hypothetical protein
MITFVRRYLPPAALVALGVVLVLALASESPPAASFPEPPVLDPLPRPDLGVGPAELTGVVVDGGGRPVADAGLVVLHGARIAWTWTDRDGRFRLTELPDRAVDVALVARGFEPARVAALPGPGEVRLVLARRIDPAPELPGLGALDLGGRVEFTSLETPAEGYELALLPVLGLERIDSGLPRRVRVAEDGTFIVEELLSGEYELVLLPPDARGGHWPNLLAGPDGSAPRHEHPAPGGGPTEDADDPVRIELRSRAGSLAGRLSDRRRAGGATWLGGAVVRVEPLDDAGRPDPVRVLWTVSDAEGGFAVRHLPAGRYRVSLAAGAERRERDVIVRERARIDPDL